MFAIRNNLVVRIGRKTALKSSDELVDVLRDVEGVFSGRFLSSPPSWILEWVDVGSKKIQSCTSGVVECARFCANDSCNRVHKVVVESRADDDRLWERGSRTKRLSWSGETGSRTKGYTMLFVGNEMKNCR